jgi:lysophospholipase L1-like esterase
MHPRATSIAFSLFITFFIPATVSAQRGPTGAADQPAPRTDANSKLAHTQMLANLKKGRIDIYFAGDSITRRWRATDYPQFLANWNENFFGWNAANFAWGGDRIQNMLWRIQDGELDGVHPKVIVLLAGTNNVGSFPASDAKVADISRGIKALLDNMRKKAPMATIIVMGILPRNDGARPTALMASINKINENIAKFADGKTVRYININDKLAEKDGKLLPGMTVDRLHLSLKGYQVWADALKPLFRELLGPPAKEDHAPPPTGDPSAAKKKPSAETLSTSGIGRNKTAGLDHTERLSDSLRMAAAHIGEGVLLRGDDGDTLAASLEFDNPVHQREQSVVLAAADVSARVVTGTALPHQDAAGANRLVAVHLDAQPLTVRLAAIPRRALTFLVCHVAFSISHFGPKLRDAPFGAPILSPGAACGTRNCDAR